MQRLAEAYPVLYFSVIAILGASSFSTSILLTSEDEQGKASLALNSICFFVGMGFFSSKHHNIDRVAARHVAFSFRFLSCALFVTAFIALYARLAHLRQFSPWRVAAICMQALIFFFAMLVDCLPRISAFVQFLITVKPVLCFDVCGNGGLKFSCRPHFAPFLHTEQFRTFKISLLDH
jgi:hypothetical protein